MSASCRRPWTTERNFSALKGQIDEPGYRAARPVVRVPVVSASPVGTSVLLGPRWWTLKVARLLGPVSPQVTVLAYDVARWRECCRDPLQNQRIPTRPHRSRMTGTSGCGVVRARWRGTAGPLDPAEAAVVGDFVQALPKGAGR